MKQQLLVLSVLGLGFLVSGCEKTVEPPYDQGVCYLASFKKDQPPKFLKVKGGLKSIEYCAAQLEALRLEFMRQGDVRREMIGTYQGQFLFVSPRKVEFSRKLDGPRFTLLVKTNDGRLAMPGAFNQVDVPPKAEIDLSSQKSEKPSDRH